MKKSLTAVLMLSLCFLLTACFHADRRLAVSSGVSTASAVSEVSSAVSAAPSPEVSSSAPAVSSAASKPAQSPDQSDPSGDDTEPQNSSTTSAKETVNVTITAGQCVTQIAKKLESNGVCSQTDFFNAVNNYAFSDPVMSQIPTSSERCYRLEGYLYPDTYTFYKNTTAEIAISRMLKNARMKIGSNYSYSGYTNDQVVIMASIVEKEAPDYDNMRKVAAVFYNRLKANMMLQADSTVFYLTKYSMPDDLVEKYKEFYNTVKRRKGLPAGPICSPGANALKAASNPDSNDYLYFASDKAGNYYYARTLEEQNENIKKYGAVSGTAG